MDKTTPWKQQYSIDAVDEKSFSPWFIHRTFSSFQLLLLEFNSFLLFHFHSLVWYFVLLPVLRPPLSFSLSLYFAFICSTFFNLSSACEIEEASPCWERGERDERGREVNEIRGGQLNVLSHSLCERLSTTCALLRVSRCVSLSHSLFRSTSDSKELVLHNSSQRHEQHISIAPCLTLVKFDSWLTEYFECERYSLKHHRTVQLFSLLFMLPLSLPCSPSETRNAESKWLSDWLSLSLRVSLSLVTWTAARQVYNECDENRRRRSILSKGVFYCVYSVFFAPSTYHPFTASKRSDWLSDWVVSSLSSVSLCSISHTPFSVALCNAHSSPKKMGEKEWWKNVLFHWLLVTFSNMSH